MKKSVLYHLEKEKNNYVSGEYIAKKCGVSRMTVSKAVAELKKAGAVIESSTKCGYRLLKSTDRLRAESVLANLSYEADVYCHECIGSTNDEAKRLAVKGCAHGTLVIAESQSAGRGRYGRSFYSPAESGLYMSIVIKPNNDRVGIMYTVAAAVAVRDIISRYAPDAKIKWVNDIYLREKKVAGILCEAVSSLEAGELSAVICGIGINLTPPCDGFPEDIKNKAGYLRENRIDRAELAAALADSIMNTLSLTNEKIISDYSKHMMLVGRRIYYSKNGKRYTGIVRGVDGSGGLIVDPNTGMRTVLTSGEVRLEAF